MKSVGEAMAIGRTFKESLQKCLRSLPERGCGKAQPQHIQTHSALKSFPRFTAIPALRLVLRTQSRSATSASPGASAQKSMAGAPREFITPFGLNQPGAKVALKVYVILTTGNEAGSAAMFVQRPASVQLLAA